MSKPTSVPDLLATTATQMGVDASRTKTSPSEGRFRCDDGSPVEDIVR